MAAVIVAALIFLCGGKTQEADSADCSGAAGQSAVAAALLVHFKFPSFRKPHCFLSFAGSEHSSNAYRIYVWRASAKMFMDNWWFGVGPGNSTFPLAYGLYMKSGFDALGTYCVPLGDWRGMWPTGPALIVLIDRKSLRQGSSHLLAKSQSSLDSPGPNGSTDRPSCARFSRHSLLSPPGTVFVLASGGWNNFGLFSLRFINSYT
jgi:hypothetical protein